MVMTHYGYNIDSATLQGESRDSDLSLNYTSVCMFAISTIEVTSSRVPCPSLGKMTVARRKQLNLHSDPRVSSRSPTLPESQNLPSANPNSSGTCFRSFQDKGKPARIHRAYGRGARATKTHPTNVEPNMERPAAPTLLPMLMSLPFFDSLVTMEKYAQTIPAERIMVMTNILSHLRNRFVSNPVTLISTWRTK